MRKIDFEYIENHFEKTIEKNKKKSDYVINLQHEQFKNIIGNFYTDLEAMTVEKMKNFNYEFDRLIYEQNRLNKFLNDVASRLSDLDHEIKKRDAQIDRKNKQIDRLKSKIEELENDV